MSGVATLAPYDEDEGGDVSAGDESAREEERPAKKQKKWFEDASDDEQPKGRRAKKAAKADGPIEVQTLEDLEALATGLLG